MSEVYEIADQYVLAYAALDPIAATDAGIAGHDHELTDYSPDGDAARDRLDRDTLAALEHAPRVDDRDRIAADVMIERLATRRVALHDAGEELRDRCASSAARSGDPQLLRPHGLRHRARLGGRGAAHRARAGSASRASKRHCAKACARGSSRRGARRSAARTRPRRGAATAEATPFFVALVGGHTATRRCTPGSSAAAAATDAYARLAVLPPRRVRAGGRPARSRRPGALRAVRRASFNGIELDLDETYAWGWEELYRIEDAMRDVARAHPARRAASSRSSTTSTTTPAARSKASTSSSDWNQDLIDRRSPSSTARTSTSPNRCAGARR